jgi:hypothetical protein
LLAIGFAVFGAALVGFFAGVEALCRAGLLFGAAFFADFAGAFGLCFVAINYGVPLRSGGKWRLN